MGFIDSDSIMWLTIPKVGIAKLYTSGWPKYQKRCKNKDGSPPADSIKNDVLRFLSNKIRVIADARTGKIITSKMEAYNKEITRVGKFKNELFFCIDIKISMIKFIEFKTELIPSMCILKSSNSMDEEAEYWFRINGGYNVQPVPNPSSIRVELTNNKLPIKNK